MDKKLLCMGCNKPYCDFPLDIILPDSQWKTISGRSNGSGILCASCIVERGAKLPGVTVAKLIFE